MTTDPATFTGLLEVCHANGLPTHGWEYKIWDEKYDVHPKWARAISVYSCASEGNITEYNYPNHLDSIDIAAVCFEVARWLRDERGVAVDHQDGQWFRYPILNGALSYQKRALDCADNEPAALLAACKEVGK